MIIKSASISHEVKNMNDKQNNTEYLPQADENTSVSEVSKAEEITPETVKEDIRLAALEAEAEKRSMPKPAAARLTYSAYSDMRPDDGSIYAPIGIWSYIGMIILFGIPVIGYICSIIYSFAAKKLARKRFAIAVFVIKTVSLLLIAASVITVFVLFGDRIMGMIRDIEQEFAFRA